MPRPINELETIRSMYEAGYWPTEAYPSAIGHWSCLHLACGQEVTIRWNQVQQGKVTHRKCPAEISSWSSAKRWIREQTDDNCACGNKRWAWTHNGCDEEKTDGDQTWCSHVEHWTAKCRACALAGKSECSVNGCTRPHYIKGWCKPHHRRWQKTGDVQADMPIRQWAPSSVVGA